MLSRRRIPVTTILIAVMAFAGGVAVSPYLLSLNETPSQQIVSTITVGPSQQYPTITAQTTLSSTIVYSSSTSTAQVMSQNAKWIGADSNVVSYLQASNYAGQLKTVEGTIVRTYTSSKGNVFLDFHDPYQGFFDAVIFSSDLTNFHFDPASFYLNKEVRITGTIQLYQGAPEIIVHSPSQIEVANIGFNYP